MSFLIIYLDGLAPLIPLIYMLTCRKALLLKELFPLFIYLASQFIFNLWADIFSSYEITNYFIFHINLPISLLALLFFIKNLGREVFYTPLFFKVGICLIPFFICDSIFFEKTTTFNGADYSLCCLYILIFCLRYFWLKVRSEEVDDILNSPSFWFIAGLFLYYCSCFIVFSSYRFFIETKDPLTGILWRFNNIMLLAMCILITKGIKCKYLCLTK